MDDADLPKALIKRIAKKELNKAASKEGGDAAKDVQLNKDVLLALTESSKVFISYLTSTANDICKESKRQTISAEDVFTALEDLEFPELVEPMKSSLKVFKVENKERNKQKAEQIKKRKAEKELSPKKQGPGGMEQAGSLEETKEVDAGDEPGHDVDGAHDDQELANFGAFDGPVQAPQPSPPHEEAAPLEGFQL